MFLHPVPHRGGTVGAYFSVRLVQTGNYRHRGSCSLFGAERQLYLLSEKWEVTPPRSRNTGSDSARTHSDIFNRRADLRGTRSISRGHRPEFLPAAVSRWHTRLTNFIGLKTTLALLKYSFLTQHILVGRATLMAGILHAKTSGDMANIMRLLKNNHKFREVYDIFRGSEKRRTEKSIYLAMGGIGQQQITGLQYRGDTGQACSVTGYFTAGGCGWQHRIDSKRRRRLFHHPH